MPRTALSTSVTNTPKKKPKKRMSPRNAQLVAVAVVLGFIAVITAIVLTNMNREAPQALPEVAPADAGQVVRDGAHLLTEATPESAEVVLVEFLDFQCPACASASVIVEDLAAQYGDRLSIAVRHLPLTSIHPHAVDAALAAEAAAAQGQFAAMYQALFSTQPEWSVAGSDQSATFRALAGDLGLDLDEYDRVVDDPATLERIALDQADAAALGVMSTPSFFLNGELVQLTSLDDLRSVVEGSLQ
jgi:protein-disulfide isomerase